MISSIFNSKIFYAVLRIIKVFKSLISALMIIVCIEGSVWLFSHTQPDFNFRLIAESILQLNYLQPDVGQKYNVGYKMAIFHGQPNQFIQIGDSSGAYGIRPRVIASQLPDDDYVNTNCCADVGFDGYAYTADYVLRHSTDPQWLILAITPYSLPAQYGKGFSEDIKKTYTSLWSFFYRLPSQYYRYDLLYRFYYHRLLDRNQIHNRVMNNLGINPQSVIQPDLSYLDFMRFTHGWLPYFRKGRWNTMPRGACGPNMLNRFYDHSGKPTVKPALKKIKKIADKYRVTMAVIFNPVACTESLEIQPIMEDINSFKEENPDVFFPFPFIRTWSEESFSDEWHLSPGPAVENSRQIGIELKKLKENLPQA